MKSVWLAALAAVAFATPTHAQDIVVNHAQGETTLSGVPAKVLVQDWATFDNLNALGIDVAGAPSSNVPGYLADKVPAEYLQLGSLFEPDFEGIAASESDVYFVSARSAEAYGTAKDILPTIDMSLADNSDILGGIKANLVKLGDIFGRQAEAEQLNAALDAKVEEVKAAAADKGNALVIVTNAGNVGVYGPDSRVAWIHNQLGIPSAMADVEDGDHGGDGISMEFILETNPDWLFVVDRDAGTGETAGAAAALLDNELVNQTKAAQEGHIIYLDPQAAYITMHGYQGVMLLLDQVLAGLNA
ncbi:siderophore ABC transporter substrate-binding protein [Devosia chinhatensis]|uniref:Iron ABC transporter substrate-binding protein n=1 Tax=Devosia chinhatensis TaxID=429727 RepID=A0A0F5FKX9_9HYPH|nr:ABC transporter substrate-binding protein [Devosia chinhatensis]KKB08877.1 iron ABC transporter substrate-binding protein [Devosia chinhatensis]